MANSPSDRCGDPRKRMKLIPNAKRWYLMPSVWIYIIIGLSAVLMEQWHVIAEYLPDQWKFLIFSALSLVGVVSRLVQQESLTLPKDKNHDD